MRISFRLFRKGKFSVLVDAVDERIKEKVCQIGHDTFGALAFDGREDVVIGGRMELDENLAYNADPALVDHPERQGIEISHNIPD